MPQEGFSFFEIQTPWKIRQNLTPRKLKGPPWILKIQQFPPPFTSQTQNHQPPYLKGVGIEAMLIEHKVVRKLQTSFKIWYQFWENIELCILN